MAEQIIIPEGISKAEKYETLILQFKPLVESETDMIANMANISAALKEVFGFFWVGFYIVRGEQLTLGPFQGSVACTRIRYGKGVCGTAWEERQPILVPDVNEFPGHIACSALSRSEIVVPVFHHEEIAAVLDVDSEFLNHFDETDEKYLSEIAGWIKF
ncbi:GAF domain-containing protein [Proteiniphilum sp. UBA5346]|uniref:GAF domain-containing protein n=1 Tax=Proteiniphilum sp. UBA5346 TaxID=1947277 RepID=UPI00257AB6E2|nr:GAF domain-containing protein [Proteiniphilum sp. UBA5346]